MNLSELSIKHHVLAWMLSSLIILFGVISYVRIGVDRLPAIDLPVIVVTTTLRGADPNVMDTSVTSIIESAVNTTPGIEHIQSNSSPGVSTVAITFALSKNIDVAYNEVQSKVNQIVRKLPSDSDAPIIQKVDTNAQPVMWLSLSGDRTIQQLNIYATNILKKKLETIDGVGEVTLSGRRDRVIRVTISPERMSAYSISTNELIAAFRNEHIQLPGGFLVEDKTEKLLNINLEFHSVRELEDLIVSARDRTVIKLKDIATIEDGLADNRQVARYNGRSAVGLGIIKIANTNTLEIIQRVERKLVDIRATLPAGMSLNISTNDGIFIRQMVTSLQEHLIDGTILAALIVWVFLCSFRATLIIAIAIPVSLLGAISVMYFCGFTFNSMTLLALLLLVGVVVDDAIVILENISRHLSSQTKNNRDAAMLGASEVTFAVIAASLSLVCIFAPVIFMDGVIGKFLKSFAVVVTCGVLASLFVALTLTPMLCSRYLTAHSQSLFLYRWFNKWLSAMDNGYQKALAVVLRYQGTVLILTLLLVLISGWASLMVIKKDFVPETDEASFSVSVRAPLGSSLAYTDSRLKLVEEKISRHKEVVSYFSAIGSGTQGQVNRGYVNIRLSPKTERQQSQQELIQTLKQELETIAGIRTIVSPNAIIRGQRSEKLQFNLTGINLQELAQHAERLRRALSDAPNMGRVDLDVQLDLPQLTLSIDRVRANNVGLSTSDVANAVSLYVGGIDVANYNDKVSDGQRYYIRLKASTNDISQVADLHKIYLRGKQGQMVRLDAVAEFKSELAPAVISRYDLQYAANFYANPNMPLGDAVDLVKKTTEQLTPNQYTLKFSGQAEEFGKTFENIKFIFFLAFILLYMVLASQFNSFLQPFIIMLSQPLAIIGGLIALAITHESLNVYSMIGLVLLIGLVAKNSILLIDLTNRYREQGMSIQSALQMACPKRLRPVLMTSCTIILALLPTAIGLSSGSETNKPLSIAVIGGMVSSTLLTLIVVPAAYASVMTRVSKWSKP